MKVMLTLAPDNFEALARRVRACDQFGFSALGFGDSPGYHDPYVSIALAIQHSRSLRLGPMVTNVVTRAPQVTGRALRSLDELSGGRVFAGIGAGDSALAGAKRTMETVAGMRAGIEAVRSGWRLAERPDERWRFVIAANGPRTLEMAAEVADVVVTGAGIDPLSLARARAIYERGAARNSRKVEMWAVVRMVVADDETAAVKELRPLLASGANHVFHSQAEMDLLPEAVRNRVQRLRERYDYEFHGQRSGNPNAELVDELDLRPYLGSRFAIAGSPARIVDGIRALAGQGVAGVVIPAVGVDTDLLIERLGREVLPAL